MTQGAMDCMTVTRDRTLGRILKLRRLDLERLQARMGEADARDGAARQARAGVALRADQLARPGPCPAPALLFYGLEALAAEAEGLAAASDDAQADRASAEAEARHVRAECEGLEAFLGRQAELRRRARRWR